MKTAASKTTKQATVMSQAVARENPNPTKILALMAPFVHIYSVIARNYGEETETLYARVFLTGDGSGECDRELMSSVDCAPDFDQEDEDVELVINTGAGAQEEAHKALLCDVAEYIAGEGYRRYSFIDEVPGEVAEGTWKLETFGEVSQR